jgi:hypothetical protein
MTSKIEKSDAEWRSALAPEAYQVLRHEGTERAGTSAVGGVVGWARRVRGHARRTVSAGHGDAAERRRVSCGLGYSGGSNSRDVAKPGCVPRSRLPRAAQTYKLAAAAAATAAAAAAAQCL